MKQVFKRQPQQAKKPTQVYLNHQTNASGENDCAAQITVCSASVGLRHQLDSKQPQSQRSDQDFGLQRPKFAGKGRRLVVAVTNDTQGNDFVDSLRDDNTQIRLGFLFLGTLGEMLTLAGVVRGKQADELPDKFAFLEVLDGYHYPVINGLLRHGCGIGRAGMANVDVETDLPLDYSASVGLGPNYVLRSPGSLHDRYLHQLNIPANRSASGVRVAVVDSGYERSGVLSGFIDLIDLNNAMERDNFGHGTAMASIIADVAKGADVYSVRASNQGIHVSEAMLGVAAASLQYEADIVNLSFGLPLAQSCKVCGASSSVSRVFYRYLFSLAQKPLSSAGPPILVAATGNNGVATGFDAPAAWNFTLAVGSINSNTSRSSFSNYGTSHTQYIMMPGGEESQGNPTEWIGEADRKCYGTSASAAYASGVLALYMANPAYSSGGRSTFLSHVLARCRPCANQNAAEHGLGYLPLWGESSR